LTGLENIYLQGPRSWEMRGRGRSSARCQDEIVAFRRRRRLLIDTPREALLLLGHARASSDSPVAAHLDPDVLLIDEVLSVGDIGVSRSAAIERMSSSSGRGVAIAFVFAQYGRPWRSSATRPSTLQGTVKDQGPAPRGHRDLRPASFVSPGNLAQGVPPGRRREGPILLDEAGRARGQRRARGTPLRCASALPPCSGSSRTTA